MAKKKQLVEFKKQLVKLSIIDYWKDNKGETSLDKNKQYWTVDATDKQALIDEKFINDNQFKTFSCKDWFEDITKSIIAKKFNPAIVYISDKTIWSPIYLYSLLLKLEHNAKNTG